MLHMRWVPLYVLAALVTGLHNFYGLMEIVNGAPINLLNCISLLGSVTLVGAAVLLRSRLHAAAKLGFLGSVLCWVYYAPLTVVSLIIPFSTFVVLHFDVSFRFYCP